MRRAGLLGVVLLVAVAACTERPCNPAITPGGSYQVQLLDVYDANSRFQFHAPLESYHASQGSCDGVDGLEPNVSLNLQTTGESSDPNHTCNYVVADLANPPAGLTISGPGSDSAAIAQSKGNEGLYVLADVATGECEGTLLLKLSGGGASGGVYSTPTDGARPPALLYRLFVPSRGPCQPCQDTFSASVTRG